VIVGEHRGNEVGGVFPGIMCRLGYRGSSSMRVGDTLGDLRRGSGVATLGGGCVRSRLIREVFGTRGPGSSGSMTWVGSSGLPYGLKMSAMVCMACLRLNGWCAKGMDGSGSFNV
jgi:hypothetical protein